MLNQEKNDKNRRLIRLKNYDYSRAGAYFVTVCVNERRNLFGGIENGKMALSAAGEVARFTWNDLTRHNTNILLDEFVIMPNHMHGIIIIKDSVGAGSKPALVNINQTNVRIKTMVGRDNNVRAGLEPAPTHGLPEIVRQFKTFSAKRVNQTRKISRRSVWQRNYYEHIVRDDNDLSRIREYIVNNPEKWLEDEYYVQ